jgi:signal transduction histidine kinase
MIESMLPIVTSSLLVSQALLVSIRVRSSPRRLEALTFILLIALVQARVFMRGSVAGARPGAEFLTIAMLWCAGEFLARAAGARLRSARAGAVAILFSYLLAYLMGYRATLPFLAFHFFCTALLTAAAFLPFLRLWGSSRPVALLAAICCGGSCLVIGAFGQLVPATAMVAADLEAWLWLGLSVSMGWMVFQVGYPVRSLAWSPRNGQSSSTGSARLDADRALAALDRSATTGLLALGAAHDFKSTLAQIRALARHGLAGPDAKLKDEAFRLILEVEGTSSGSAVGLLQRVSTEGREQERSIDASRDFGPFLRMARAGIRGEGIVVRTDLAAGSGFRARMGEVEQALLSLVRNSVEAYRGQNAEGTRVIELRARRLEGLAVLEVSDMAGGIPEQQAHLLFSLSSSGSGSTGVGLYLARWLAHANSGTLEYVPIPGGSMFRLAFPLEEEE